MEESIQNFMTFAIVWHFTYILYLHIGSNYIENQQSVTNMDDAFVK